MDEPLFSVFQEGWHWLPDHRKPAAETALTSFAADDTLCEWVGRFRETPVVRTWVHHNQLILGSQDVKLPRLKKAVDALRKKGIASVVRNSGGAAVLLDEGVLNLSLILPAKDSITGIDRGYRLMEILLKESLSAFAGDITTGEVNGSYCPGRYDMSLKGKKLIGIAQRRRQGAVSVQAFINVTGSGSERAEIVKQFYDTAADDITDPRYLHIRPETVASLQELSDKPLTVDEIARRIRDVLTRFANPVLKSLPHAQQEFQVNLNRLQSRQTVLQGMENP